MRSIPFNVTPAALAVMVCIGCASEGGSMREQAPAEVGGRFSIGGWSTSTTDNPYGYEGELDADERALREQSERFDRTVWQGVLLGALAGTVIGAVAGGDAEGAAGGAMIGATVGMIAGIYVASKQQQFASLEDQIESMTSDVRASNREAEALIASAKRVLAEERRRLAAVNQRLRAGQATQKNLEQERARAWGNRKIVEKAAQGARDQGMVFESAKAKFTAQQSPAAARTLETALKNYQRNIETLDEIAGEMGKA